MEGVSETAWRLRVWKTPRNIGSASEDTQCREKKIHKIRRGPKWGFRGKRAPENLVTQKTGGILKDYWPQNSMVFINLEVRLASGE